MNILDTIENFYLNYSDEKGVIGYSVDGTPIYYFALEKSARPVILAQYSIHAREYITSYLALKMIEDFSINGKVGKVYFIPLMNPDGVKISLLENPLYKANKRGVDLNVNFDARWGMGKKNLFYPSSENYIGNKPFSEPETQALRDFTLLVKPDLTLSYHSKGEEIYWNFFQKGRELKRDRKIAEMASKITEYKLKYTFGSAGGYKDWCIEKLKIPALTLEVGDDSLAHPIFEEHAQSIFLKNKVLLTSLMEIL